MAEPNSFQIGSKDLRTDSNIFIIAEACDNHLGSLETAYKMIDEAFIAGADAIKFQHHIPDEEMLRDCPSSNNFDEPLYEFLQKYALSLEQHYLLKSYCDRIGIIYLCTPFSLKAAIEIDPIVSAFKIGSGELCDLPTLDKIADLRKPMILSTGMSTFDEIDRTYNMLTYKNSMLALLNCTSEYPPVYEDLNLNVIPQMIQKYPRAIIGHSDHTPDIFSSIAAIALGAKLIEKHVTIDKSIKGPDSSVSITFSQLSSLVQGARQIEKALGSVKKVNERELSIRSWAHRSIVSAKTLKKGDIICSSSLTTKRPGTGIPASYYSSLQGKIVANDVPENTLLSWSDIT